METEISTWSFRKVFFVKLIDVVQSVALLVLPCLSKIYDTQRHYTYKIQKSVPESLMVIEDTTQVVRLAYVKYEPRYSNIQYHRELMDASFTILSTKHGFLPIQG